VSRTLPCSFPSSHFEIFETDSLFPSSYSCKKLKPTWDTLGERFSNVKSKLTVAKFDATENDVPSSAGFKVSGFPTIKFKAAGSKEWISYEGDRSLDSLVEFLEANATNDISAPDDLEAELEGESTIKSDRHDELVRCLYFLLLLLSGMLTLVSPTVNGSFRREEAE
jgi:hypothetical protein